MKKILILYASIGLGHKSIAENIGFYLQRDGYEVQLADAQKVQGGVLESKGKKVYQWLVQKFPGVWEWLYNTRWFISITLPFRTFVARFNYNEILQTINLYQPDVIISTHTTASAIVSYLKKQKLYTGKFGIAFSDFHLHRYWLYGEADFYLANIEEQKKQMVDLGISANKIFVCGISLKPQSSINVEQTKTKFNITPEEKVVLISSGSQGFGVDEQLIKKLSSFPKTKVIVVCGNNQEIFEHLKSAGTSAIILGYYSPMDELYAISNLFITKAGALSVSEALQWRLPIIISHLLPGQEWHNYEYLERNKLVIASTDNIIEVAQTELQTQNFKNSLKMNPILNHLFENGQSVAKAVNQVLAGGD